MAQNQYSSGPPGTSSYPPQLLNQSNGMQGVAQSSPQQPTATMASMQAQQQAYAQQRQMQLQQQQQQQQQAYMAHQGQQAAQYGQQPSQMQQMSHTSQPQPQAQVYPVAHSQQSAPQATSNGAAAATASTSAANPPPKKTKPQTPLVTGDQLAAFCETLDSFVPTIPDEVIEYYLKRAGVNPGDNRVVRMVSLATQKFVADVANDALAYSKQRAGTGTKKSKGPQTLTMSDLQFALNEQGITVARPPFYT